MIELANLSVFRNTPNSLDLEWAFKTTAESLDDYELELYVSQAPSLNLDEYTLVDSGVAADTYAYEDYTPSGISHGTRQWYYKFKIINTTTDEESVSKYYYVNNDEPNKVWLKIWKDKNLVLSKKSGRPFFLLKRRTWGTRCTVSWDPILFQQNTEVCADCNCWGTGWRDGFFKPQEILGMTTPAAQVKDPTVWGEFYPTDVVITMLNRPPIEIGDVIIDPKTDQRYYVQRKRTLDVLGVPIEQQGQLSLIHVDDEIYNYSIEEYR